MKGRPPRHRVAAVAAAAACLLMLAFSVTAVVLWRAHMRDVTINATATLTTETLESAHGALLADEYTALGGTPLTRHQGAAVFMSGTWNLEGKPGPHCQIQLAAHSGNSWQLFGWASDHVIVGGTINSWGSAQKHFSTLNDFQSTVTLATVASGRFMLVWQTPTHPSDTRIVKAKLVYACGSADRDPRVFDVVLK
jgi:hypothetical protein